MKSSEEKFKLEPIEEELRLVLAAACERVTMLDIIRKKMSIWL